MPSHFEGNWIWLSCVLSIFISSRNAIELKSGESFDSATNELEYIKYVYGLPQRGKHHHLKRWDEPEITRKTRNRCIHMNYTHNFPMDILFLFSFDPKSTQDNKTEIISYY